MDEPVAGCALELGLLVRRRGREAERAALGDHDQAAPGVVLVEPVIIEDQVAAGVVGELTAGRYCRAWIAVLQELVAGADEVGGCLDIRDFVVVGIMGEDA